jgi:hypothetical protein
MFTEVTMTSLFSNTGAVNARYWSGKLTTKQHEAMRNFGSGVLLLQAKGHEAFIHYL